MAAMDSDLKKAGCLAPLLVSALVPVHAASILAVDPLVSGLGDGTDASATFETGAENNDSAPGSPADGARDLRNTLTVDKTMGQLVGGAEPYIDLVFTVETVFNNTLGITEYAVTETLTNNTGAGFSGFTFQLGFGTGAEFADNRSTDDDGLDFDEGLGGIDTPLPMSDVFSICDACSDSDELTYSNGVLATGETATLEFQLDIPDLFFAGDAFNIPSDFLLAPDDDTGFAGGYTFTIRQTPTFVPVPAALWLFASALGLLSWVKRTYRRL